MAYFRDPSGKKIELIAEMHGLSPHSSHAFPRTSPLHLDLNFNHEKCERKFLWPGHFWLRAWLAENNIDVVAT